MCDDDIHQANEPAVSRRAFSISAMAAAALAAAQTAYAQATVVEKDVQVKTADGTCDAVLFYPQRKGTWPAVLMWPDILGLRPVFRDMGRRLASAGYVVLVPNPFYRSAKAPVVGDNFDFNNQADRQKVFALRGAMTDPGIDSDAKAYLAFLDAQPQTNKKKKAGVQGYCMGGPLSVQTAVAVPARIGAVGTFHGGTLVSKQPNSPHLLFPKTKAAYLICEAQNDDKTDPTAKDTVNKALDDAKLKHKVEVYPAAHGWCVKGSAVYDETQAERAWGELLKWYKTYLV